MNMKDWAKHEVELACERERKNSEDDSWNYGVVCYESALKAFNSLLEDDHSGMSIVITQNILNRLISGNPLTPIEDIAETWSYLSTNEQTGEKTYQCNRMSSLFKQVDKNGNISYNDVDRCICYDVNNPDAKFTLGITDDIVNGEFPITMPYYPPNNKYVFKTKEVGYNPETKEYDGTYFYDVTTPEGEIVDIGYAYLPDSNGKYTWFPMDEDMIGFEDAMSERKEAEEAKAAQASANENAVEDVEEDN